MTTKEDVYEIVETVFKKAHSDIDNGLKSSASKEEVLKTVFVAVLQTKTALLEWVRDIEGDRSATKADKEITEKMFMMLIPGLNEALVEGVATAVLEDKDIRNSGYRVQEALKTIYRTIDENLKAVLEK